MLVIPCNYAIKAADLERIATSVNRAWAEVSHARCMNVPPDSGHGTEHRHQSLASRTILHETSHSEFQDRRTLGGRSPAPALARGFVLVRNHFSLISAGTERSTVSTAQASLLGKARQRPDLVRQVLDSFRRDGFAETLKRVRTKLETLKELGYSSAGTVLASFDTQGRFQPGDRVACGGGGYASHAGIVTVPQNLVVKVPDAVGLDAAAFTTLGAIAMQGVRQANPRLGEFVCVIGLGLLGQITAQILRANGCQVFGVDTAGPWLRWRRKQLSCGAYAVGFGPGVRPRRFHGRARFRCGNHHCCDAITDPVELATAILRQKGVIVIVGPVPMNIPREPHFYKKELELKISCSYGPGRYDPTYEEQGHDYPYGYVRWTENRNMEAFVKLLENQSVDVQPLVTHVFEIEDAEKAYDIVTGKVPERHLGMLLKYSESRGTHPIAVPQAAPDVPGQTGHRIHRSRQFRAEIPDPVRNREASWFPWRQHAASRRRAWARNSVSEFYSTDAARHPRRPGGQHCVHCHAARHACRFRRGGARSWQERVRRKASRTW